MIRTALHVLLCLCLALPLAGQAEPAAPSGRHASGVSRCFELRVREPAAAMALADELLADAVQAPGPEDEAKLQACIARAAALLGDEARTVAAAARIDALLATGDFPPAFQLRALSNAGAALHTVGRIHEALDFYGRAYAAAARDESKVAQVTTLINIGAIHGEELGAPELAEQYYARAEAIESEIDERDPTLPYNRGINLLRLGREDAALAAFLQVEARAAASGHEVVRERARAERIALQADGMGLGAARQALGEAAAAQQASDPAGAALTRLRLSRLALAAGDATDALAQALAAQAAIGEGPFSAELRGALEAEIAARRALGHWPEALAVADRLRRLEVEKLRAHQLAGLAGLQARLEDTRSAEALERLQDERRLEALRLEHARRLRNGAIAAFVALALLAAAFVFYQRRVNRSLSRLSTVDSLTGLLNRRAGDLALQEAGRERLTGGRRAAVFLVDVDRFKEVNDRHGHATGDTLLAATAARLRGACRPGDVVARWGGEEFLVLCRGLDPEGAAIVAERLRAAVSTAQPLPEAGAPVTVSIGFAGLPFRPGGEGPLAARDALAAADRALYAAKHAGRDTWVGLWGADGPTPLADLLADPAAQSAAGSVRVLSRSTPVQWPPAPA